jgi:hypothetical protein
MQPPSTFHLPVPLHPVLYGRADCDNSPGPQHAATNGHGRSQPILSHGKRVPRQGKSDASGGWANPLLIFM